MAEEITFSNCHEHYTQVSMDELIAKMRACMYEMHWSSDAFEDVKPDHEVKDAEGSARSEA